MSNTCDTKQARKVYQPAELFIPERRKQTNGRGVGLWLLSWGTIALLLIWYIGLEGGIMWALRITGLLFLLLGSACFGMSFERVKE